MTLYWPHEREIDLTGLEDHAIKLAWEHTRLTFMAGASYLAPEALRTQLLRAYSIAWFGLFNGSRPRIEGKYQFTRLVRELDFLAPASLLISPTQHVTPLLRERAARLDSGSGARLCKPIHSSMGQRLRVFDSVPEAVTYACRQKELILVQSLHLPVNGEYRIILHRTPADVQAGKGPSIRIAAKKVGPTITGDGVHTARELVALQRRWSIKDRRRLLLTTPGRVLPAGEQMVLINACSLSGWLRGFAIPEPDELARLDDFILRLTEAIETVTGPLATACYDVGMTKDGPMVYELQLPFGSPYGRPRGIFPEHRRSQRQFALSTLLSGRSMV